MPYYAYSKMWVEKDKIRKELLNKRNKHLIIGKFLAYSSIHLVQKPNLRIINSKAKYPKSHIINHIKLGMSEVTDMLNPEAKFPSSHVPVKSKK